MLKKHPFLASNFIERFLIEFTKFTHYFSLYLGRRVVYWSLKFEGNKNILVKLFMMKRGRYSRPFLHFAIMIVIAIGIVLSPILASTYPIFSRGQSVASINPSQNQSIVVGDDAFGTQISQKPRDKTITYAVQRGDTLSSISKKFGISVETIKWANNLFSDSLTVGDDLQILPVTGISYKVSSGDTIYTIAKRFDTDPQKIVDFPFNDFANPETFSLVVGQNLMVPDGVRPSEQPTFKKQVYIAAGPSTPSAGGFSWPLHGIISQFASWYHMALDIAAPYGAPIVASNNGVVTKVDIGSYDGGYGNNAYVDGGNGFVTHYAHMSSVSVSAGQSVVAGQTIVGYIGLTGRTTGAHLHFEIMRNGVLVNPISFLP
jgi:murein DD-endopeptidase MepM/ murein hydrolase activator NlpD